LGFSSGWTTAFAFGLSARGDKWSRLGWLVCIFFEGVLLDEHVQQCIRLIAFLNTLPQLGQSKRQNRVINAAGKSQETISCTNSLAQQGKHGCVCNQDLAKAEHALANEVCQSRIELTQVVSVFEHGGEQRDQFRLVDWVLGTDCVADVGLQILHLSVDTEHVEAESFQKALVCFLGSDVCDVLGVSGRVVGE
jgi:hypothetical protein